MSVNSHGHEQFPRKHYSKTSVYSGGFAARDTYHENKVRKVSPETGGFAAGALSYYYDHNTESEGEDHVCYQKQMKQGILRRDQHHFRSQQDSRYNMKYQYSLNRSVELNHPRKEYMYFRNDNFTWNVTSHNYTVLSLCTQQVL